MSKFMRQIWPRTRLKSTASPSVNPQRLQHRLHPGHFMGPEQVRPPQSRQHCKKWLRQTHLLAEILERMRQSMTDRKTQSAQPNRVQESPHLIAHTDGTVLKIAVVESKPRVQENLVRPLARRRLDLSSEIILHQAD